jgi:hypothetical protein
MYFTLLKNPQLLWVCDTNTLGITYHQGKEPKLSFIWAKSVGGWSLSCDGRYATPKSWTHVTFQTSLYCSARWSFHVLCFITSLRVGGYRAARTTCSKMANLVQESLDRYHLRIHSISCISCRKQQSFCLVNHRILTIQLESTEIHWTATQFSMLNEPPNYREMQWVSV